MTQPDIDAAARDDAHVTSLADTLDRDLNWLGLVIERRMTHHFNATDDASPFEFPPPPELGGADDPYTAMVSSHRLNIAERLVLILALAPWLRPQILDVLMVRNRNLDRPFTEFGGVTTMAGRGFAPTRETAMFLIAGTMLDRRLKAMALFAPESVLVRRELIARVADEPIPWAMLEPHRHVVARLLSGAGG